MTLPTIACPHPVPRPGSQGIDRVSVSADQRRLTVSLIASLTFPKDSDLLKPENYGLTGGRRLHPRALSVAQSGPAEVTLYLDQPGDFSIYTLTVRGSDVDPFFSSTPLSFKIACQDPFDCRPPAPPPVPELESPEIDYLTKDYAGFRQLLLDQVATRLPEWTERSEADLGIAVIELLAEAADRLSYYQDRIANEAYLGTASQRRSVQLHTALIGYRLRPGVAASTYLAFQVTRPTLAPGGTPVQTAAVGDASPVTFETSPPDALLRPEHNTLTPYTWANQECCLPVGATAITVRGDLSTLDVGQSILIADDEDADRREVVTLVEAPVVLPPDPIKGDPDGPLTLLRWSEAQALRLAYCLEDGRTVVQANLVAATHGMTIGGATPESLGEGDESLPRLRLDLSYAPLTFVAPFPGAPPDQAVSSLEIQVAEAPWAEVQSLVESGSYDRHYRLELDDDGRATVVFGDGGRGQKPLTGAPITARYRVGIGPAGNVGRDTLTVLAEPIQGIEKVTNPLAATGGRAPESPDHARRVAPLRIRTPIRCVTEADYERAATDYRENGVARVQRAKTRFVWTGSWLTVFISIDPIGSTELPEPLRNSLRAYIQDRKLAGYDLEISATRYVPLLLGLQVCVQESAFATEVAAALLRALSNTVNPDGSKGFFHPDQFSFGDPVLLSRLYAAIEAVPGVDSVVITALNRLHERDPQAATQANLAQGFLAIAATEIARLDNDASFPENGRLSLQLLGGR